MPVNFLSPTQHQNYVHYPNDLSPELIVSHFFLDDQDKEWIARKRSDSNRLGYALHLVTVRFLGAFINDLANIPLEVVARVASQINVTNFKNCLKTYQNGKNRKRHIAEIKARYGYKEFTEKGSRFRLGRRLCALCWTGTDRPGALFDQAVAWLCTHKILLPGVTVLERFIAEIRSRMEMRLWKLLIKDLTIEQQKSFNQLLVVKDDEHQSLLDMMRKALSG